MLGLEDGIIIIGHHCTMYMYTCHKIQNSELQNMYV